MTSKVSNPLTRRRLRIAQQAFRAAEALAWHGISHADRVAAVVQLDFAVETVVRAYLADGASPHARREQRFTELLKLADDMLVSAGKAASVPMRAGVEQLRGVRNAAQHEARVPTQVEVAESMVHARETLVELTRLAWDSDFFEADLEAIRSDEARERLHRAVGCQGSGDTHSAMGWIRAAFEYAFANGGENLVGPVINVAELLVVDRGALHSSIDQDPDPFHRGEDAAIALRRLQILGRLTAFGMNVTQYLHWRDKFSDAPPLNMSRELSNFSGTKPSWTEQDYQAGFAYVVDSILSMEQVVPDIDPGGFGRGGFDKL